MTTRYYTGIGSRECPSDVLRLMEHLAYVLAKKDWILRSGGAPGADTAFYKGAWEWNTNQEIYLPWKGFQGYEYPAREEPQEEAYEIAAQFHPRWQYLKYGAKKLHARNAHQVLGYDVTKPILSEFIICWTTFDKYGEPEGGTSQALRMAKHYEVPIFNLGCPSTLALISAIL